MDISLVHITKIERKLQSQSELTKVQLIGSTHKPSNDPPAQLDDPNDSLYQLRKKNDDLMEKIVLLTYKNGQLLSKCKRLRRMKLNAKSFSSRQWFGMLWREIRGCRRLGIHMGFNKMNTLCGQSTNKKCTYDVAFQIWHMQIWRPRVSHLHHPARLIIGCGYGQDVVSDFKTSATIQLVDVANMLVQIRYVPHNNVSHTAWFFFWKTLLHKNRNKNRLLNYA